MCIGCDFILLRFVVFVEVVLSVVFVLFEMMLFGLVVCSVDRNVVFVCLIGLVLCGLFWVVGLVWLLFI